MADSSQAALLKRLTDWSEGYVRERAIARGWHVIRVSDVGERAALAEGRDGKIILPDLQLLDVNSVRVARFVEVKAKPAGAYKFQQTGQYCTGFDLHKLVAYRRIRESGIPVDIALIHLKHHKEDAEYNPYLLWAKIEDLPTPMTFEDPNHIGNQLAVWDVTDGVGPFQFLGHLIVPPDIIETASAIKRKIYVWDKPPRLRLPRDHPQLDFDV